MHELIFEVMEEPDGGYSVSALGESIITEGKNLEELRENIREAVLCHFEGRSELPQVIRLHFVRQEVFAL